MNGKARKINNSSMKDYSVITKFLHTIEPLTLAEEKYLANALTFKHLKKGQILVKPNQIAKEIAFVISGVMRVYQIVDGKELTSYFSYSERNPFVSSYPSFLQQKAAKEYVEAIEDCEVIILSHYHLQNLYSSSKTFEKIGRLLAEKNYLLAIERIESLQYKTAADRYKMFMNIYPGLLNRIQHHYIASYLGIAPESLSRIRKYSSKIKS